MFKTFKVEFFQSKTETDVSWRSFAQLNKTDVHSNCALAVLTPPYRPWQSQHVTQTAGSKQSSNKQSSRVKVYYRLHRPSTGEHSDKWTFFYCDNTLYDEFRLLFGERVLNESRLMAKLFPRLEAEKKSTSAPTSSESSSSNNNKRKMEIDESATTSNDTKPPRLQVIRENSITGMEFQDSTSTTTTVVGSRSKRLLKKWYKQESVERSTPTVNNETAAVATANNSELDEDIALDEQRAKLIESVVNTPTSTNEDDEVASTSSTSSNPRAGSPNPSAGTTEINKRRGGLVLEKKDTHTQTEDEENNGTNTFGLTLIFYTTLF